MFENKKIFILGMARSGYEAAKLLSDYNNEIIVTDGKEQKEELVSELESLGVKVIITSDQLSLLDDSFDYVIKNPGIKYDNPVVVKAKELGIKVINEIEMAYSFLDKSVNIIGVTGSNGKTTTTTLISEFMKNSFDNVYLGGNIGIPLSNFVRDIKPNSYLVLEISDHQLCDIHDFKTNISVLTNICPTHLDYHGTYEHYKMTKAKIFNKHTEKDIAIINYENQDAIDISKNILSQKYYFSSRNNKVQAYFDNEAIYLNDVLVLHKNDIKLQGIHNYENIMAALLVCSNFNLDINKIKDFLKTFGGVEHRLEFVRNYNGVDFYNDSKSTNPTSTITALKTFNKPIHLILGGLNRNQDYHQLDEYITHVKYIYAIGEVTDSVFEYAKSMNIPCYKGYTLDEAMRFLKQNIKSGEVVLLSPGASSQDQYLHFEDRGIEFKNIVEKY